jgi:hypothetical protein
MRQAATEQTVDFRYGVLGCEVRLQAMAAHLRQGTVGLALSPGRAFHAA